MNFKKVKKLFCGLLASAGILSTAGVSKAADAAAHAVVENNDVSNGNADTLKNNPLTEEPGINNGRDIIPISYEPTTEIPAFDVISPENFETDRLSIENFTDDCVKPILDLYDESVFKWMAEEGRNGATLTTTHKIASIFPHAPQGGGALTFVVKEKTTKKPIGVITASIYHDGTAKFSYWLGEQFRGKGYGGEALNAFGSRLFALPYIRSVGVRCFDDNVRSLKLKDGLFKKLNELYENNFLIESIGHEKGVNISHHFISKFAFDPEQTLLLADGKIRLDKVNYVDLLNAFNYLLSEKNKAQLPENVKENLKIKLKNLKSGDLKFDNSTYFYVVTEQDAKLSKSAGFVSMNTCDQKEDGVCIFEVSYVDDEGKESNEGVAAKSCFLLAKSVLCGSTEKKVRIKLQKGNTSLSKEITHLLESDPSQKILKVNVEKDSEGNESLFIEKKVNNVGRSDSEKTQ